MRRLVRSSSWLTPGALIGAAVKAVLIVAVRAYQVGISPLLIGSCKFVPTCSEYYLVAVERHGLWRGSWLGLRRVMRCHPFGPGGYDPVPPRGPK